MSTPRTVAVLVGSLRQASFTRKIAKAIAEVAPAHLTFKFIEIGDLPLYNEELEAEVPAAWARFREEIHAADAFLFATPEYNRSVPAALKNAIDVGSRPYGHSGWTGKPAAVVSTSMGPLSGFGANHHLRQSLVFLNMPVLQQPEAYLGLTGTYFDDNGQLVKEGTREFLTTFANAFSDWIEKVA